MAWVWPRATTRGTYASTSGHGRGHRQVAACSRRCPRELDEVAAKQRPQKSLATGIQWAVHWVKQLERELEIANSLIESAAAAKDPADEGQVDLEHAFWRLGSAHDKLLVIAALVVGPVTLERRGQSVAFRPSRKETLKRLAARGSEHSKPFLRLMGCTRPRLLLRHQQSHSLAPITGPHSLIWIEVGEVEAGGLIGYSGRSLVPEGGLDEGITVPGRFGRALKLAREAMELIDAAAGELASVVADLKDIEVPPIVWKVTETEEIFLDEKEAIEASRRADGCHRSDSGPGGEPNAWDASHPPGPGIRLRRLGAA